MKTHLDNLLSYVPDIFDGKILDLGSGRGSFLIDVARRGGNAFGVEPNPDYILISTQKAQELGLTIDVRSGTAENIPFPDDFFGFVNICEVIEHVEKPDKLLGEVNRVLKKGGIAYLSAPNRFGVKDQHFHLYFVNWLPRKWSDLFISIFGQHKNYHGRSGRQRLKEMHYFTHSSITRLAGSFGFAVSDIRKDKINNSFKGPIKFLAILLYKVIRVFYFDSFHLKLIKK